MKTYARIEAGVVVELFETAGDITEMFHPDLIWVDVTHVDGIAERWIQSGGDFLPPAAVSLSAEAVRADLLAQILALELQQARPVREITAAIAAGVAAPAAAVSRLADIDAQIAALRAQLP